MKTYNPNGRKHRAIESRCQRIKEAAGRSVKIGDELYEAVKAIEAKRRQKIKHDEIKRIEIGLIMGIEF